MVWITLLRSGEIRRRDYSYNNMVKVYGQLVKKTELAVSRISKQTLIF